MCNVTRSSVCLPLVVPILLALVLNMLGPSRTTASVFPEDDWIEMSPSSQGVDPQKLEQALAYLESQSGSDGIREVVVIRNGYMIWKGDNIDYRHWTKSIAKIFTSTVFGLLIDDGVCAPETMATTFAPSLEEQYPTTRLEDFATMISGYDAEGGANWGNGLDGSDTPWIPTDPMFSPGEAFLYWDDAVGMFGYLLI
jgi:hypothetical protein